MAIRLVVFDAIGTAILDGGAVQQTMRETLATTGLEMRSGAMDGVAGMTKFQAIRTLLEGHGRDDLLPRADAIHADFAARVIRRYRADAGVAEMPGAVEAFDTLRRAGVRVAIDTGFTREVLDVVLGRVGWAGEDGPLDATVASDEVPRGRPHPDMIDALRTRLGGIPYAEVAKVGDTPIDL
ncbi:MAG: HAD family hydrolase, partial [Gemmatimonadales bacterium]